MPIDQNKSPKSRAYDRVQLRRLLLPKIRLALLSHLDRRVLRAFGRAVAAIRIAKELSVYDLTGDDMPIKSRQHWQKIESGQKNINLTTVFKVASTLQVTVEKLFIGILGK
jgi:hypothetical protein